MPHYLPGYKSGGPIRTIQGIVEHLGSEFDFYIVTLDRDAGDKHPYPEIAVDTWSKVGKAHVYYTQRISLTLLRDPVLNTSWDLVYFQSFFNMNFTVKPLVWLRLRLLHAGQILVAPRGQFSSGAIAIRSFKKRSFLLLSMVTGLYKNIFWQASSVYEKEDMLREIGTYASPEDMFVASDIPPKSQHLPTNSVNPPDRLQIIFLSRITRMKNLHYAINILGRVSVSVQFNIYGPVDQDVSYWRDCKHLLELLPEHVSYEYKGVVHPGQIGGLFSKHDLFLFPTQGENFGHVILESLCTGCPVVLSDQTSWDNLEAQGVGWTIPLSRKDLFVRIIEEFSEEPISRRAERRQRCKDYASRFLADGKIVNDSRRMLTHLTSR